MGFLTDVVAKTRRDLREQPLPEADLRARAAGRPAPLDFQGALAGPEISLIAEVKRSSPSAGAIAAADPATQARAYERGGAAAVSVLTQAEWFDGTPQDLTAVRWASGLPVLRKDFVVAASQVLQARALGADAVLLIAAAVSAPELIDLLGAAADLGMAALVEAHGPDDLEGALASGAPMIGINARNLETLEVDPGGALLLARAVPGDRIVVLESGIATRDDVVRAEEAGAAAVLVGEALMRAADPAAKVAELLGRGASGSGR